MILCSRIVYKVSLGAHVLLHWIKGSSMLTDLVSFSSCVLGIVFKLVR